MTELTKVLIAVACAASIIAFTTNPNYLTMFLFIASFAMFLIAGRKFIK